MAEECENNVKALSNKLSNVTTNLKHIEEKTIGFDEEIKKINERKVRFKSTTEKCDHCDKTFTKKSDLENHMSDTGIHGNHKCNQCESVYFSEWRW